MSGTRVAQYKMNPAEDVILFGDEITDGMWVLPEFAPMRHRGTDDEDAAIRAQRFRRVTRLRRFPASGSLPPQIRFVAEWVDGYAEVYSGSIENGWIVKRESMPGGEAS
jgi:hypothetical protein